MKSSWWKTAFFYGIGLVVLAYVLWSNWDPGGGKLGIKDALSRPIHVFPYLAAAILCATNIFLTFVRWFLLVRAQELPFTLKSALRLGLVGYFFNTFLPGSVGGDLLKAAFIAQEQQRRTVAVATVLIDRAVGLCGLVVVVALTGSVFWLLGDPAIVGQPYLRQTVRIALALLTGTLAMWGVLGFLPPKRAHRFAGRLHQIPKIGGSVAEFWRAVWLYRTKGRVVLTALLMSLVGHTCSVLMFYCVVQALAPEEMPSLRQHFLIIPVGMIAQAFFPAPGGVGGGEFVFGWLYEIIGFPAPTGVLGSLGQRILAWGLGLVAFFVYLFMKKDLPRPISSQPEVSPVSQK